MQQEQVLIAGQWKEASNPSGIFHALNTADKSILPRSYPISGMEDIKTMLLAGKEAALVLLTAEPYDIARFLEACAGNIEARTSKLVERANQETALPIEPRLLSVGLPRTTSQLRKAARQHMIVRGVMRQ